MGSNTMIFAVTYVALTLYYKEISFLHWF